MKKRNIKNMIAIGICLLGFAGCSSSSKKIIMKDQEVLHLI
ncbi:hypothetical protein QCB49_02505 [Cetobacterium somerae]